MFKEQIEKGAYLRLTKDTERDGKQFEEGTIFRIKSWTMFKVKSAELVFPERYPWDGESVISEEVLEEVQFSEVKWQVIQQMASRAVSCMLAGGKQALPVWSQKVKLDGGGEFDSEMREAESVAYSDSGEYVVRGCGEGRFVIVCGEGLVVSAEGDRDSFIEDPVGQWADGKVVLLRVWNCKRFHVKVYTPYWNGERWSTTNFIDSVSPFPTMTAAVQYVDDIGLVFYEITSGERSMHEGLEFRSKPLQDILNRETAEREEEHRSKREKVELINEMPERFPVKTIQVGKVKLEVFFDRGEASYDPAQSRSIRCGLSTMTKVTNVDTGESIEHDRFGWNLSDFFTKGHPEKFLRKRAEKLIVDQSDWSLNWGKVCKEHGEEVFVVAKELVDSLKEIWQKYGELAKQLR